MTADITVWALRSLSRLLPVDEESLKEVITYSVSLPKEEAAAHLKNLLGDSPQALEFISSFNSRRLDATATSGSSTTSHGQTSSYFPGARNESSVPKSQRRTPKKAKPLHSPGPVRQPEGYGDVTGGYRKKTTDEFFNQRRGRHTPTTTSMSSTLALPQEPVVKTSSQQLHSPSPSSSRDPSPRQKLPSAAGSLTSDMPNVRNKQLKRVAHSSSSTASRGTTTATTTASINDLTSAIAALELSTDPSLSTKRRRCPCNASIHPLFTTAPNCLSCGKIICALEGLQPCSFCDSPILTREQVLSMIRTLKEERGYERMVAHNARATHSGSGTPVFDFRGGNTPESSGDEASSAAARARAHRDKLLAFQRENVQRTKVHDEAADFDMTLTPGASQWMSPVQRAAALKKQQKYMREMEELNKPEWEKKKTVMSMRINEKGKLVKIYETVKASMPANDAEDSNNDDHDDNDNDDNNDNNDNNNSSNNNNNSNDRKVVSTDLDISKDRKKGSLNNNPLLNGGMLVRPIWEPPEGERGKGIEATFRQRKWRRVQDDQEDARWILNGGLHGREDDNENRDG
jgi:hypothetical protein